MIASEGEVAIFDAGGITDGEQRECVSTYPFTLTRTDEGLVTFVLQEGEAQVRAMDLRGVRHEGEHKASATPNTISEFHAVDGTTVHATLTSHRLCVLVLHRQGESPGATADYFRSPQQFAAAAVPLEAIAGLDAWRNRKLLLFTGGALEAWCTVEMPNGENTVHSILLRPRDARDVEPFWEDLYRAVLAAKQVHSRRTGDEVLRAKWRALADLCAPPIVTNKSGDPIDISPAVAYRALLRSW